MSDNPNTDKYLSIPPYISTSWKNVRSLKMEDTHLVITLTDGSCVNIPNLDKSEVTQVFTAHAEHMSAADRSSPQPGLPRLSLPEGLLGNGMQFRLGGGMEGVAPVMHHDPSQSHTPNLPPEVLEKIAAIARIVVPPDSDVIPKAEPHCNCIHCQVARAIQEGADEDEDSEEDFENIDEEVSDEELTFREWDIKEAGDQMFEVANPLNKAERYKVCLKAPVGCTCGVENCPHLLAVLRN